ncbi:hypothetical protein RFM99_30075 [Mesorhizobium sp. VK4C]|nr:hypothetical protein [Mesorhizobium sp. VK4C]MDX8502618.1 hypothetical protein [Mesorhizobium sp. VK4C]
MDCCIAALASNSFPGGLKVNVVFKFDDTWILRKVLAAAHQSANASKFSSMVFVFDEYHPQAETIVPPMIDEPKQFSFRLLYRRIDTLPDGIYHERIAPKSM